MKVDNGRVDTSLHSCDELGEKIKCIEGITQALLILLKWLKRDMKSHRNGMLDSISTQDEKQEYEKHRTNKHGHPKSIQSIDG